MHKITEEKFCQGYESQGARLITLRNRRGVEARFTNYGARWVGMSLPESAENATEVVLGFDSLRDYVQAGEKYHGAVVGRVCGRIGGAAFPLDGRNYALVSNDAYGKPVKNHLHGGIKAFHNQFWDTACGCTPEGDQTVTFSLFSADGEEGYPGNLRVRVVYTLPAASDTVVMECWAESDRPTVVNLTNHAFFNLAGHGLPMSVCDQRLTLAASRLVVCDQELIPTGELAPVVGTYADFTQGRTFGDSLAAGDERVQADGGFTLAYVLDAWVPNQKPRFAARIDEPLSGRCLEIFTDQPSVQVYNGYFMDGSDKGHAAAPYFASAGLAVEPQGFPDAPNRPEFPSIVVDKEHPYHQRTEWVFSQR